MDLEGRIARLERRTGKNTLAQDEFGALLVSQQLPPLARLNAAGKLFQADTFAGTAKPPVVAPPTTSPEWALYNASPKESLVVLEVAITLKAGTTGLGLALLGAVAIGPQTIVSSNYSSAVISACNGSKNVPDAYIVNNPTLLNGTPAWRALDGTKGNTLATDSVGDTLVASIGGALIAPPDRGMVGFEVLGETGAGALFMISVLFAMLELDRY